MDKPMTDREIDEAAGWEYWHQRAHKAEANLAQAIKELCIIEARVVELEAALREVLEAQYIDDDIYNRARAALNASSSMR